MGYLCKYVEDLHTLFYIAYEQRFNGDKQTDGWRLVDCLLQE